MLLKRRSARSDPHRVTVLQETARIDCRPLLARPSDLTVVFSPVVDLTTAATVGWTAAPRFPGTAPPQTWSAAARDAGLAGRVQALFVLTALQALPDLPAGTCLVVPVGAALLGAPPVQRVLDTAPSLDAVVVELVDDGGPLDAGALLRACAVLTTRGARLAAPAALLHRVPQLRPQLLGLARPVVAALVGADPSRSAVADAVLAVAGTTGARALADGVETAAELAALIRAGVPLARGWLLGSPADQPRPATAEVARLLRSRAARIREEHRVAALLRPVRSWQPGSGDRRPPAPVVLLDAAARPDRLLLTDPRTGACLEVPVTLSVPATAAVVATLHRALARGPVHRFDPVLCTGGDGEVVGLLRVEDLAGAATAG